MEKVYCVIIKENIFRAIFDNVTLLKKGLQLYDFVEVTTDKKPVNPYDQNVVGYVHEIDTVWKMITIHFYKPIHKMKLTGMIDDYYRIQGR